MSTFDQDASALPSNGGVTRAEMGAIGSHISREIVRLHAKLYGRGPTKAKTYVDHDYALTHLEEVFTPAEKTLIQAGNTKQVQETRNAFQEAVEDQFVAIVEQASGRTVKAFVSQIHIGTDAAMELFFFERPEVENPPDRGRMGEPS